MLFTFVLICDIYEMMIIIVIIVIIIIIISPPHSMAIYHLKRGPPGYGHVWDKHITND